MYIVSRGGSNRHGGWTWSEIGSASIDHASRWDLDRGSPLHSSSNGKTGIHVNGLRGLCRPLPPHSCFFSFSSSLASRSFSRLPFSSLISPSFSSLLFCCFLLLSSISFCSRHTLFLFLRIWALAFPSLYARSRYLSFSFLYFQIRISVIRTTSLDETLFIDASSWVWFLAPRFFSDAFIPCAGYECVHPCVPHEELKYMCIRVICFHAEALTVPSLHENFVFRNQR